MDEAFMERWQIYTMPKHNAKTNSALTVGLVRSDKGNLSGSGFL
jgi:hypothetical protein